MRPLVAWLFGLGLMGNAMLFLPQAFAIWKKRSAAGISLLSFAGFNVVQFVGVLHGWFERDWPLLAGMLASLLTCGSVTLLTVRFRNTNSKA
jgi:MtN3 and saliva related transmembrane protein